MADQAALGVADRSSSRSYCSLSSIPQSLEDVATRTAVSVDHFHLIQLANQALTEVRQQLSHQVRGSSWQGRGSGLGTSNAAPASR